MNRNEKALKDTGARFEPFTDSELMHIASAFSKSHEQATLKGHNTHLDRLEPLIKEIGVTLSARLNSNREADQKELAFKG